MRKTTWIIIVLFIVIIILVFIITTGNNRASVNFEQIRTERDNALESARISETELSKANDRVDELEDGYNKVKKIVDDITAGSKITDKGLSEYEEINQQLDDFIQQYGTEE